ncbi:class Ib ribonucleoside-diphosphate reductase assembly flavoprotein NrdI [Brevibacillus brevis]|uniref:Protein NrdI n=1 Tax=Brevibacillus brevis TaxID=1393 RepID=A0ABY9SYZ1_BREBE|nr:class Ib ribonucleoside-diphosphate reductase assembly flavoprotein NrdI [Brevibacillus brevis]WNC12231.1 class Ib ribonucleoside-diphosphate reductase assembly flavoprotein NrdI [Brevibacillus brevis]
MLIAYDSKTGNVRRFVNKLPMRSVEIDPEMVIEEPFVLVTYTTGFGQVPAKVDAFLKRNHTYMRGVSASGNRNWGATFAKSADTIASKYGVPVISKFELSGTSRDIEHFTSGVATIAAY